MGFSVRFEYRKRGDLRFLSHLDVMGAMERALLRSRLPVAHTRGFHPRPKVVSDPALPLGHESEGEGLVVTFRREIDPEEAVRLLNGALPVDLHILRWRLPAEGRAARGSSGEPEQARHVRYELHLPGPAPGPEAIRAFMERDSFEADLPRKGRVDLRAFVEALAAEGSVLRMTLRSIGGRTVRPEQVLAALAESAGGTGFGGGAAERPDGGDPPVRVVKLAQGQGKKEESQAP